MTHQATGDAHAAPSQSALILNFDRSGAENPPAEAGPFVRAARPAASMAEQRLAKTCNFLIMAIIVLPLIMAAVALIRRFAGN